MEGGGGRRTERDGERRGKGGREEEWERRGLTSSGLGSTIIMVGLSGVFSGMLLGWLLNIPGIWGVKLFGDLKPERQKRSKFSIQHGQSSYHGFLFEG